MKVHELMTTHVRACRPEQTLNEAARLMWEADCGCVPVVDAARRVVGMLTDRDICMAAYTQGRLLSAIPVAAAMSKQVVSCRPADDLAAAQRAMQKAQVRRLPVVDGESRLAGLLSLSDILRQTPRDREHKTRAVPAEEVTITMAAICEPRTARRPEAATTAQRRSAVLLTSAAPEPEC